MTPTATPNFKKGKYMHRATVLIGFSKFQNDLFLRGNGFLHLPQLPPEDLLLVDQILYPVPLPLHHRLIKVSTYQN